MARTHLTKFQFLLGKLETILRVIDVEDPRISGTRRPPAHLRDVEFRRDEYGIRRILVDGRKPVYEVGGHFFSSRAEAMKVAQFAADLVGLAEAAEVLGWDRRRVSVYIRRGKFPEPVARVAAGPLWTRQQIEEFKKQYAP